MLYFIVSMDQKFGRRLAGLFWFRVSWGCSQDICWGWCHLKAWLGLDIHLQGGSPHGWWWLLAVGWRPSFFSTGATLQCSCVSPWQRRWLPPEWVIQETEAELPMSFMTYCWKSHHHLCILYWSHKPALNQCGRGRHKKRNTLWQRSLGTILEAGYSTILLSYKLTELMVNLGLCSCCLFLLNGKESFPRFVQNLLPRVIQSTTQCDFFKPDFPDHLI